MRRSILRAVQRVAMAVCHTASDVVAWCGGYLEELAGRTNTWKESRMLRREWSEELAAHHREMSQLATQYQAVMAPITLRIMPVAKVATKGPSYGPN